MFSQFDLFFFFQDFEKNTDFFAYENFMQFLEILKIEKCMSIQ